MQQDIHTPVLLKEVLTVITPQKGDRYLDVTAGYGGHAAEILHEIDGMEATATLIDRDSNAIEWLRQKFESSKNVDIIHDDFYHGSLQLLKNGQQFDIILADLGVSSPHLDNLERGFSFMNDGPLDMRMNPAQDLTAAAVVNTYSRQRLADVLHYYGEVRGAYRMCDVIIAGRPYNSTKELADAIPGSKDIRTKILSQVFQAIRIEVNQELDLLKRSLPVWLKLLAPGGRLAVITFHSLEDRLVKEFFLDHGSTTAFDAELNILTKRPIEPSKSEIVFNPRARSSKLRVAQRK